MKKNRIISFMLVLTLMVTMLITPSTVSAASKIHISKAKITLSYTTCIYDGKAKKPAVTVKYKNKTLRNGKDYTVGYSNNVKPGNAVVTVYGKGKYIGSTKRYFKINGKVTRYYEVMGCENLTGDVWARDYFDIVYDSSKGKVLSVNAYQREKDSFQSLFRSNGIRKTGTWTYRSVWALTTPSVFGFDATLICVESKYRIDPYGKLVRTYSKLHYGRNIT